MKNYTQEQIILSAKEAIGIGTPLNVGDFQHVVMTLSSASSANFTVKFQTSNSDTCPDFSAGQTVTNRWDYVQVKDYQNNSAIDGDTGITFAGTDDVRIVEANTNGIKWICAVITAISVGAVTLTARPCDNQ